MAISSPDDISGLIVDLDPHVEAYQDAAGTNPAAVNDTVANVPDQVTSDGEDSTVDHNVSGEYATLKEDANGWKYLDFDGSDDHLFTDTFDHSQPVTLVMVAVHNSGGGAYLFANDSFRLRLFYSSSTYKFHAGSELTLGTRTSDRRNFICVADGSSSALHIDGSESTGDAGAEDPTDLAISGYGSGGVNPAPIEFYRFLAYSKALSSSERSDLNDYLTSLYDGSSSSAAADFPFAHYYAGAQVL